MTINLRVGQFKRVLFLGFISLQALFMTAAAPAQTYQTIFRFRNVNTGLHPTAGLIQDAQGNFYGTTFDGGEIGGAPGFGTTSKGGSANAGTIFAIDPAGNYSVLYSFTGGPDGADPESELIVDDTGNLLGTARLGGANNLGTVFEMRTDGRLSVLHTFQGGLDGSRPEGGLLRDGLGNLYGTTRTGGSSRDGGTVFKITPQ